MATWQYAWLTDQPYTTIGFSHPQPGLAAELAGILGPGVFTAQSSEWSIQLDRSRVNLGYVSGLLGDRGWEMFSVETRLQQNAMTPSQLQTNWYFKRQGPDRPAGATMSTASTAAPMQSSMGGGSMGTAAQMGAAPMAAAPATSPAMDAAPAMSSSPEMAPQMAPDAPMAAPPAMSPEPSAPPAMSAPPAAPPGPEPAPMSEAPTPPPGPQG